MASPLWALVLSENHGLRPDGMLGGVPRPLWSAGGRSMLEEALARVDGLVPGSRTVTIVGPTQGAATAALREKADPGHIIRQPGDRGTAAGILLGLTTVLDVRPDAFVLVTPADFGLRDVDQFRVSVREAVDWIRHDHSEIVLFGVRPCNASVAYGWITPGPAGRANGPRVLRAVASFVDRAAPGDLPELVRADSLWNTNMLVARAGALVRLYEQHLPYLADMMVRARQFKPAQRAHFLEEEYRSLRPAEFSRELLTRAQSMAVYTWPASIGWARLTSPDRLEAWHRHEEVPGSAQGGGWAAPARPRRAYGT
jgi:mannose-1-phosphate guanylyltransferase